MVFKWFDLVVLFGIIQGLVSTLILISRPTKSQLSQRLMVAILLVLSLLSFKIAIHSLGLWDNPIFTYFPLAIDLLIQPLLYCYVASLTLPNFKLKGKVLLHFLPVLLFICHAVIVYIAVLKVNALPEKNIIAEHWKYNHIKAIEDDLSVASTIIYGLLSFRLVTRYRKWLYQCTSDASFPTLEWLRNILVATGILGLGLLINIVLDQVYNFNVSHFLHWEIFYIYLSGLIYFIAFRSYRLVNVIPTWGVQQFNEFEKVVIVSKYGQEELQKAKSAIVYALEHERLFLNSELTLVMLAAHLKLSQAVVSEAINKEFGKSFRTLVNELRTREFKNKANSPELQHLSILGIALECGFNSEASFYRIFRSSTGMSPKQYMSQLSGDGNSQPDF
jgi:AraC-like DNA-binding protein